MLYYFAFCSKVYNRFETDFLFGVKRFPVVLFPYVCPVVQAPFIKKRGPLPALQRRFCHEVFLRAQVCFCPRCAVSSAVFSTLSPESQSFHYLSFILSVDTQQRKTLPPCSFLLECLEYRQFLGLGLSI